MAEIKTKILLRSDTKANWEAVKDTAVLGKGEIGIEVDTNKFKIGDNVKTWAQLSYFSGQTYQDNITTPGQAVGDIAVVKTLIDGDKYSYTSYVWNGTDWAAMDGNYNAANVYFDKDIQVTKTVGNVTTSNNAPVDLKFKGKNMEQIWQYLYATEDTTLTINQPSATFSVSSNVEKEVGNTFSDPVCSITFADGSYEYGSKDENGVEYKDGKDETAGVKYNAANIYVKVNGIYTAIATKSDSSNDKFSYTYDVSANDNVVIDNEQKWEFKADASCPASTRKPVTNLGNFIDKDKKPTTVYADGVSNTAAQSAKSLGEKTFKVTGYRGCFWGYKTSKAITPANINSAQVRALGNAVGKAFSTIQQDFTGMQQMFFAAPKGTYSTVTVINTGNGAPQTVSKVTDIMVEGANSYTAVAYDVFYVDNDNADGGTNNYKITFA